MAPDRQLRRDWRPAEADRLLLQALLLPGQPGQLAWQAWSARVALDDVGAAAYPLLPELEPLLMQGGVAALDLGRLQGISRKTWYENQLRLAALGELITVWSSLGCAPLLLRGAVPVKAGAPTSPTRNNSDMACGIPLDLVPAVLQTMVDRGWRPALPGANPQRHWRSLCGMAFRPPGAQPSIQLLWRLAPDVCAGQAEAGLWQRSRAVDVSGHEARLPEATDRLWLACAGGAAWHPEPDWRWAVDAVRLIASPAIDWPRLAALSQQCQTTCLVRDALGYLASELLAPVPASFLAQLQSAPVSPREARLFQLTSRRVGRLGAAHKHWLQYRLRTAGPPTPTGFLRYLEAEWGLGSTPQALLAAGQRAWLGDKPAP